MSANTSADGLIRFFGSVPNKAGRPGIDRLGQALKASGAQGLSYGDAMARSRLSSSEFLDVVYKALATGVFERFAKAGEDHLRLSPSAQSLFPD